MFGSPGVVCYIYVIIKINKGYELGADGKPDKTKPIFYDESKQYNTIDELDEYSRLFNVDVFPVIYQGTLTETMKEAIMYFINTSEDDLEYIFGEKSFSYFFYKILNPKIDNSFLMDEDFQKNLEKMIMEVFGDRRGCCGGYGGSMHLLDKKVNFMGSIPILGSAVSIASGMAMANKLSNKKNVTTVFVGDGAGTSISSAGAGTLIYNNAIANKVGEIGSWAKQGGGTLSLGGVSTYSGDTMINNGILLLTTGNDRLPPGTVVSLGQAASANVGTLNLNGLNQQIAGLASTTGINASANKNTVTSTTAATLTINVPVGVTRTYGDGTALNSGVITGALSLEKIASGTQVLGDANSYSGTTTISAGTLQVGALGAGAIINNAALIFKYIHVDVAESGNRDW